MPRRRQLEAVLAAALLLAVAPSGQAAISRTYTLDADFDEGVLLNVNHDAPNNNQLQVNANASGYPNVWVAKSGTGTLVRIDVNTGQVLGEYRSAPEGSPTDCSRTTVDLDGNAYATNRAEEGFAAGCGFCGSIVKVGLVIGGTRVDASRQPNPAGGYLLGPFTVNNCVDRNGDGLIRTSRGLGDVLAWPAGGDFLGSYGPDGSALVQEADDECLLMFQRVTGRNTRHVSVDADETLWVGGYNRVDEHDFQKLDGRTGLPLFSRTMPCGGYGGFIDCHGIVWSADVMSEDTGGSKLLRYDPLTDVATCITSSLSYGLGVDRQGFVWNAQWTDGTVAKFDSNGVLQPGFPRNAGGAGNDRGVAVRPQDDSVWVANSGGANVSRLDGAGNVLEVVPVPGFTPTGVAVDSNGNVWATLYDGWKAVRIHPVGSPGTELEFAL